MLPSRLGALVVGLALLAPTAPAVAKPGAIARWVTAGSRHLEAESALAWAQAGAAASTDIVIEPGKRKQSLIGFGAAFTDAACYNFDKMPVAPRRRLIDQLFSPKGLGLNIGRLCLGASDYATVAYSYDDGEPDPELKRFSLAHDQKYIIPVVKEARRANPDLYLFGSPWSPPGWMKPNNSMFGGCMSRTYMTPYANYFLKFLQGYAAAGVPVQAVTIQNEVDTEQGGRMPACAWPQEYEMSFAAYELAPLLAKEKVDCKIWLIDHNYSLWGRALAMLEDTDVRKAANAVAWHGYNGDPAAMTRVHDAYPQIDQHWTEGGPDITSADYATDWTRWGGAFTGILRNWCRSITAWNLALDEKGKPNIGPFPCGGVVTIDSKTHGVRYSGQYWALAHFSKFMRPGSVVLTSSSANKDVQHVAARTPDGKLVLVLTNGGAAREATVRIGANATKVALPAASISTLTWQE